MASERRAKRQSTGRQKTQDPKPKAPEEVSLELIAQKLDRLTWRHSLWGVDEREVWHVVQRLDEMYRQLYQEQQIHYEALLQEARRQAGSTAPTPMEDQPTTTIPVQSKRISG